MMEVVLFTVVYIIYFFADIFPSCKKREWNLFLSCTFMIIISYITTAFILLDIDVPSPARPIKELVKAIIGA